MTEGSQERVREALRRLLADGRAGGQAKVDALVALSQRTVYVATWTPDGDGFRTMALEGGGHALPVFTESGFLERAAPSLGWVAPGTNGAGVSSLHVREVGAREALRHAVAHNVDLLVVDYETPHVLEANQEEIKPLLSRQARRDPSGPYANVGRVSSSLMKAVRPTPAVGVMAATSSRPPQTSSLPPASSRPPGKTSEVSAPPPPGLTATVEDPTAGAPPMATFGSGSSVTLRGVATAPPDSLLDRVAEVLRGFPEVEWAALADVSRGPTSGVPTVGLRVDQSFRDRVNEIVRGVREAGQAEGAALDVLLLDDPEVMRDARSEGVVFYPWRKRSS